MDEQTAAQPEEQQEPHGTEQPEGQAVDWEAKYREAVEHSRKWERSSKANDKAAKQLKELQLAQMSETERLKAQLDEQTARADALQAAADRAQWVADAARQTGLSPEAVALISSDSAEDTLDKARALAGMVQAKGSTSPVVSGEGTRLDHSKLTPKESANDFLRAAFRQMGH